MVIMLTFLRPKISGLHLTFQITAVFDVQDFRDQSRPITMIILIFDLI